MMRAAVVSIALAWSCLGGVVSAAEHAGAKAATASEQADITRLKQLSDAWDKAIVAKNRAAVADNMAVDFRIIDGQGKIGNKQQFVDDVMDPKLTIAPYTVEDFEVRLYGDMALLSGRTRMTGQQDGQAFESNYRYIDIYAKRAGQWRIVSVQITRLPE